MWNGAYLMKTVEQVLDDHNIEPNRTRNIHCPVHEDNHPSCRVYEENVYCFSCGWSADAAGLEAALSSRDVGDVLRSWSKPEASWQTPSKVTTKIPRHKQRLRLYMDWMVESQQVYKHVLGMLPPWLQEAAAEQAWELLDQVMEIWKTATPYELTQEIAYYERELERWRAYWMEMA